MIYKNSFFFCVLTQQGHGQTKLTVKSLDEIYQYLKYLESGFSNKDGPAKYALPKNTISTWIKIKVHYIDALEHSSYKRKNQRKRLWMSRARIF